MKSATTSIETSLLNQLRSLGLYVQIVGFMETADNGRAKEQDLSSVQVRAYGLEQLNEAMEMFTAHAEIRINIEQAESANGELFTDTYEQIALWLERIMLGDACVSLSTDEVVVDGLMRIGGDKDFDTTVGSWYAVFNLTITGRIKSKE